MLKNEVAIIGAGLGGTTVAYGFQQRNYNAALINGSTQDNETLPDAKNVMVLEGYDGLAGDRGLAFNALKDNNVIIKKILDKEYEKIENILSFSNLSNSTSKDKINKYFNISDDCSITIKSLSSGQGNSYMKLFSDSFYIGNKNYVRKASVFQTSLCVENETIITRNTASFGGTIYIPNDRYIRQKTPKGFEASLVGWSKGNNIWLGDYGVMGSKQIATNAYITANNIYKTTSSGSTSLSDERYKHDFKDINSALDFIMNLNPCLFKFNDGTSNRYHMGFKAQEVEKNMLNTIGDTGLTVKYNCEEGLNVDLNNPDTYILGLRYEEFIAPLIQVVQNQQKQISELKKKIYTLSNQV